MDDTTNQDNIQADENLEQDENLTNETDEQSDVEEPEQQEEEQSDAEEPEVEQPTDRQPSRREQLRVQDLLKKYGTPPQREQSRQVEQPKTNWREVLEADDEVYDRIDKSEQQAKQNGYSQARDESLRQVESVRWESRLMADSPVVEKKWSFLDKDSDDFKPAAADAVNSWYLNMVGYDPDNNTVANPNLRYSEFVDAFMELNDELVSERTASTRRNITSQARRTGLRPDGSAAKSLNLNKDPSEMTDAELNAVLGQTFRNI